MPGYEWNITYLNSTKQLVAFSGGKLIFMKYDHSKKEYVKESEVNTNFHGGVQNIGTDGQVIFVADSSPYGGEPKLWTITLDGKVVEEHKFGSGFKGGDEVETALSDNQGNLWLICPQYMHKVANYRANPAGANGGATTVLSNSTYKVKVATWNYNLDEVTSNDSEVDTYRNESYTMSTTTIPYQEIVSKYKMPFNYLWTMLVISEDEDYAFDLAKLVEDSQIEITIHDNYSKSDNTEIDYYTKYKKIHTTAHADVDYKYTTIENVSDTAIPKLDTVEHEDSVHPDVEETSEFTPSFYKRHHTINEANTLDIALTLANSWYVKYEKKYNYISPTTTESHPTESLDDIDYGTDTVEGDFGGHEKSLRKKATSAIPHLLPYDVNVEFSNVKSEYTNKLIKRSKHFDNYFTSSRYVSSVPGSSGETFGASSTIAKSGELDRSNYDRKNDSNLKHIGKIQQGFCFINDNLCAIVVEEDEISDIHLIDLTTMTETDVKHRLIGHGNTITYDKKNGDIVFPEENNTALIHVDEISKKMGEVRRVHTVADNSAAVAYNSQLDMFVNYSYPTSVKAYTRDAFYNRGSESVTSHFQKPSPKSSRIDLQGMRYLWKSRIYYL